LRDVIPSSVFEAIQRHLRERTKHAEGGWEAGSDDEDTLTGDLGGSLRTAGWRKTRDVDDEWEWRVSYKKFRGHGQGALEKTIGADGIVQVEVRPAMAGEIVTKGVLFQAKKHKGSSRTKLKGQVADMEDCAPGGSAVFEYGPNGYRAESGASIAKKSNQDAGIPHPDMPLAEYLADSFLPCESGIRGMYYDAVRGVLEVPTPRGEPRFFQTKIKHRITISARRSKQRR
jgi:hypothetical protein